jgi:hypothetical protein
MDLPLGNDAVLPTDFTDRAQVKGLVVRAAKRHEHRLAARAARR